MRTPPAPEWSAVHASWRVTKARDQHNRNSGRAADGPRGMGSKAHQMSKASDERDWLLYPTLRWRIAGPANRHAPVSRETKPTSAPSKCGLSLWTSGRGLRKLYKLRVRTR